MFGFLMISNSIFQTSSYVNKIWPIIDPFCPTAVDHLHSIGLDPSTLCLCVAMLKTAQLQLTHKVGPCNLSRPDAIKLVDKCHTMVNTKMATVLLNFLCSVGLSSYGFMFCCLTAHFTLRIFNERILTTKKEV